MKAPRLSLAAIGFAILVLAIDLAVIRTAILSPDGWAVSAFLLLPMIDALLIGFYLPTDSASLRLFRQIIAQPTSSRTDSASLRL